MTLSRVAWWCLVYSGLAILAAYLMAAWWGAGNETMPLAAGAAHGSAVQEIAIKVVAYSSAPTGLIAFSLVLWGAAPRAIVVKHRAQSNVRLISLIAVARIGNIFLNGDHLLLYGEVHDQAESHDCDSFKRGDCASGL
jgi:hypothetical protein